uniref:Solute carrier family 7 member 10 n=2 Tax=Equus TaxID=9789 RepID=A0A9L0RMY2_HORSE
MRPPVGAVRAARAARAPTDGRTDGAAAGRTDGSAQGAGTWRDSDMAGHTQQPSRRGNPGPAPSPSSGPGPGPGASERVALKKEIGLVSACTIIIASCCSGAPSSSCTPPAWPSSP